MFSFSNIPASSSSPGRHWRSPQRSSGRPPRTPPSRRLAPPTFIIRQQTPPPDQTKESAPFYYSLRLTSSLLRFLRAFDCKTVWFGAKSNFMIWIRIKPVTSYLKFEITVNRFETYLI